MGQKRRPRRNKSTADQERAAVITSLCARHKDSAVPMFPNKRTAKTGANNKMVVRCARSTGAKVRDTSLMARKVSRR
jgi:hypothetical protein